MSWSELYEDSPETVALLEKLEREATDRKIKEVKRTHEQLDRGDDEDWKDNPLPDKYVDTK